MTKKVNYQYNTSVITTRFVLERLSPILFVFRFSDGTWQFSGLEEGLLDNDYKIVSLGEIIKMDSSLLEILDMPIGSEAMRMDDHSPWRISAEN